MGFGILRLQPDRLAQACFGLVQTLERTEVVAKVIVGRDLPRFGGEPSRKASRFATTSGVSSLSPASGERAGVRG